MPGRAEAAAVGLKFRSKILGEWRRPVSAKKRRTSGRTAKTPVEVLEHTKEVMWEWVPGLIDLKQPKENAKV